MSEYFDKYGDRIVGLGVVDDEEMLMLKESGTLEELYQAFKTRLMEELRNEAKPPIFTPKGPDVLY